MNAVNAWHDASMTTLGLFWTAFWAFGLGYLISSMIQVFVTQERMKSSMGKSGIKDISLATFFGFLSSSCSFAALSTTRALFTKGAGFVPALAFLLSSTNLVVELGIVIALFLSWQFVVAEYVGGLMLILLMWLAVTLSYPKEMIENGRKHAAQKTGDEKTEIPDWRQLIKSLEGWRQVAERYIMEWQMVWKDVTIGFTVAGIIAVFVPKSFFQALFAGTGVESLSFFDLLLQTLVGPLAAFFTFIGSMGNIPLAAVLFSNGVSFAGVMAFIFSDLVVFPVLRIQAQYYGWKLALYILSILLIVLVSTALLIHYSFDLLNILPTGLEASSVTDRQFFKLDYKFLLNILFIGLSFAAFTLRRRKHSHGESKMNWSKLILNTFVTISLLWLAGGLIAGSFSS